MRAILLLLLLAGPVLADDKAELQKLLTMGKIDSVHVSGDWALAGFTAGEGGGMVLARRLDGHWKKLGYTPGGALDARSLYQVGVPQGHWNKLLFYRPEASEVKAVLGSGPCWPETARTETQAEDISYFTAWELTVMRNEIYARHGRAFKDPLLREYFTGKAWYKPSAQYSDSLLSPLEKRNAQFIADYQHKRGLDF